MKNKFLFLSLSLLFLLTTNLKASERGLIAYWDFDEGSGNVAKDKSGNGNDGKIFGAKWVKLQKGYALKFDGIDDYVDCGNDKSLDIRNAITLEVWVRPESLPTGINSPVNVIIGKDVQSYALHYSKGGTYYFPDQYSYYCNCPFLTGFWYHLVGTFDGISSKIYINGKQCGLRLFNPARLKKGDASLSLRQLAITVPIIRE